jgi:redox-sensing transcriptional repressor
VSLHIAPERTRSVVPGATVQRLPVYLHVLAGLRDRGVATVSSAELAAVSGVTSAKLRKDLSYLGSFGRRGVGYDVDYLHSVIAGWLGIQQEIAVVIVGVGNLGHALASYPGFAQRGFSVAGLVDIDPDLVGQRVQTGDGMVLVEPYDRLTALAQRCQIGIIATPDASAQGVCDQLVQAGIREILSFASRVLVVPDDVQVRHIDLGAELSVLASRPRRTTAVSA